MMIDRASVSLNVNIEYENIPGLDGSGIHLVLRHSPFEAALGDWCQALHG